jgi:hypothetical protein
VTESGVTNWIESGIRNGQVPMPGCSAPSSGSDSFSQTFYVVHLPPGSRSFSKNGNEQCGYHSAHSFQRPKPGGNYNCWYTFAVMTDETPGNSATCDSSTNLYNATTDSTGTQTAGTVNTYTMATSHEIIEAIFDPYAQGNPEIGDPCQGAAPWWTTIPSTNGPPWFVQSPSLDGCLHDQFWSWDNEGYKSSGFAVARGPYHLDAFRVFPITTGETSIGTVVTNAWDPTTTSFSNNSSGWPVGSTSVGQAGLAPANAMVTAVANLPDYIGVFVAGNDGKIDTAFCNSGDGCRLSGSWSGTMSAITTSDPYSVLPGTPISAIGWPFITSLFFAGSKGEVIRLDVEQGVLPPTGRKTVIAPAGTVPAKAYVAAISRDPGGGDLGYGGSMEVFSTDSSGHVLWWTAGSNGVLGSASTIPGSQVVPGTQIAALGRQANQLDIFAADASGAVQSYWKYGSFGWGQVTVMPAGSTVTTGAGVGVSGWWDHMDVITTDTHGGLVWTNFEQYLGWFNPTSVPLSGSSSFTAGEAMQLIAPYRGRLNVLGWSPSVGVVSERIDLVKDSTLNYTGPDAALQ